MILVTGGTGLVGSHLLYYLVKSGRFVRAIHRVSSDLEAVKKVFLYHSSEGDQLFHRIEWFEADIRKIPSLSNAFEGIEYVYHAAAFISFNPDHYQSLKKTNTEGTANVVNLCLKNKVKKLCYVSSVATLGFSIDGNPIDEETEFDSESKQNVYALTKFRAEIEVWRGTQEGLDAVIVLPGVILGGGLPSSVKTSSNRILKSISKGLSFYTPGSTGIVDVRDVSQVMISLMNSEIKNEKYILVSKNIHYKDLISQLALLLHKKPPSKEISMNRMFLLSYLDRFSNKFFRTKRRLLKAMIPSLYTEAIYHSGKIKEELNYEFIPYTQTLKAIVKDYSKEL